MVLWFLDAMPFIFAFWGQYVSSLISHEAGAMVIDQTSELRKHSSILEQKAAHDATHGSLTGLPNRVLFINRLQQAVHIGRREGNKVGVLLLDLNHFKEVNDTLGHYNGDRLLKQVATRLSAVMRASDTFARIGGDEFGVILPHVKDNSGIDHLVKKLQNSLANPFSLNNLTLARIFHDFFICHHNALTL